MSFFCLTVFCGRLTIYPGKVDQKSTCLLLVADFLSHNFEKSDRLLSSDGTVRLGSLTGVVHGHGVG